MDNPTEEDIAIIMAEAAALKDWILRQILEKRLSDEQVDQIKDILKTRGKGDQ